MTSPLLRIESATAFTQAVLAERRVDRTPVVVRHPGECPFQRVPKEVHDCGACRAEHGLFARSTFALGEGAERSFTRRTLYDTRECLEGSGAVRHQAKREEIRELVRAARLTGDEVHHSFARTTVDAHNRQAVARLTSWQPGRMGLLVRAARDQDNPAGNGVGKSHLLHALVIRLACDDVLSLYYSTADLLAAMRDDEEALYAECTYVPVLVLDNLGGEPMFKNGLDANRLFRIIDKRYREGRPIVAASRFTLDQLAAHYGPQHGTDIVSRLAERCEPLLLGGPDRRIAGAACA